MSDMAIKYAMKKKAKKMCADGGMMMEPEADEMPKEDGYKNFDKEKGKEISEGFMGKNESYAHGGDVAKDDDDLVMTIMKKRYSKGGQVSNDVGEGQDVDKMANQFDDLVLDDDLSADYTGENSGDEIGNEQEDDDRKDVVSQIMKSRKKKDRLPNPR